MHAELLADRSLRILPLTDVDAHELVRSLRSSPLLFGYRGAPALDVAALEDLLLRVARLAMEVPEITEMDLNPVVVHERGAEHRRRPGPVRADGRRPTRPICAGCGTDRDQPRDLRLWEPGGRSPNIYLWPSQPHVRRT